MLGAHPSNQLSDCRCLPSGCEGALHGSTYPGVHEALWVIVFVRVIVLDSQRP